MNTAKIKDMLAALQNINIKELIKDLQNIDSQQLGDMIRERLDIVLSVVLVLVTIVATAMIVKSNGKKVETLAWEIKQMEERAGVVKESDRLKGEHSAFLDRFAKPIVTDQLTNQLSQFAANRHVQIVSLSPVKEKADDYIKVAGVQINISSDNFKNIVLFMRDVENAPYALRVGNWSARMKEQNLREGTESLRKPTIEVNMQIGAVQLKNE